jgi:peptidoglycan/LPS O-acetylase OafA/YrhL
LAGSYNATPNRVPFLDALRGLAAIWVVVVHVAMLPSPRLPVAPFLDLFVVNGTMGVDLFFVVSAFSLCLSMPVHDREVRPMLGFALRRFFRIAPLFYLIILVMCIHNFSGVNIDGKSILLNVTFLFNLVPGYQTSIVPAGWTVGVEMVFYMMFPLLYRFAKGVIISVSVCFIFIFIATLFFMNVNSFVDDPFNYYMYSILYRAPIFTFGLIAFYLLPILERRPERKKIGLVLLTFVPVMFFAITANKVAIFDKYYWEGVMFGALVVGLGLLPVAVIVNPVSAWLGRISYSVYLLHTIFIVVLIPTMRSIQGMVESPTIAFMLSLTVTLALVIPSAFLLNYFVEDPVNKWGKRFSSRVAGRKNVGALATGEPALAESSRG